MGQGEGELCAQASGVFTFVFVNVYHLYLYIICICIANNILFIIEGGVCCLCMLGRPAYLYLFLCICISFCIFILFIFQGGFCCLCMLGHPAYLLSYLFMYLFMYLYMYLYFFLYLCFIYISRWVLLPLYARPPLRRRGRLGCRCWEGFSNLGNGRRRKSQKSLRPLPRVSFFLSHSCHPFE